MTKHKQKDNPRFSFLFGGEHYNYYMYKVTTEQASKYACPIRTLVLLVINYRVKVNVLKVTICYNLNLFAT